MAGTEPARSHADLIDRASSVLRPHRVEGRLFGDVAAALVTEQGHWFVGVCIDTPGGPGFCAEHAAVAAMVTAGEHRIERIVAVWTDDAGHVRIVPPCGRCREFLTQVHPANVATRVVLAPDSAVALRELLPRHDWPRADGTAS